MAEATVEVLEVIFDIFSCKTTDFTRLSFECSNIQEDLVEDMEVTTYDL